MRKFWVAALLLVVALGLYHATGSVKKFDPQAERPLDSSAPGLLRLQQQDSRSGRERAPVLGDSFSSLDDLVARQERAGFLRIGRFGDSWPATITEVLDNDDHIAFKRQDGSQHTYQGFDGYHLQVVRLSGRTRQEVLVVFRSAAKR